jgi:GNAT superfamily N-acetyltransferase
MTHMTELSPVDSAEPTTLVTRSGLVVEVRPTHEGDEAALATFFEAVTPQDRRFRFLTAVAHVPAAQIDAMTHIDHRATEDFIVTEPGSAAIIANAMMAADAAMDTAEVAISIRSDYKGRGIGWVLLEHTARVAKARGIRKLQSMENRENHQAIELEREMGFVARGIDGEPTLVMLEAKLNED